MIHNKKGFTLIETIIAMVIIGIITGMLIFLINSSNNAQKRTNANIKVLTELSNIYNAFSSLKDDTSMKKFLKQEYGLNDNDVENNEIILYFNSKMDKVSTENPKGYKIICTITNNTNNNELNYTDYTLATKVLYPQEETARNLVSARTIRVVNNNE